MATTRLTRTEQVERNRGRVLAAARRVFLARGYGGATVDAIAEDAGFSKGVVYSQFGGKPELFLALLEARIAERAAENAVVTATASGVEGLRALMVANALRQEESEGGWARLLIEFRVVAARDPELNGRYAALHQRTLDRFAEAVRATLARAGLTPACPPATFAELLMALDAGHTLERAAGTARLDVEALLDVVSRWIVPIDELTRPAAEEVR